MSEEPFEIVLCHVCEKPLFKRYERRTEIVNPYHKVTIMTYNKFEYGWEDVYAYLCEDCYLKFNDLIKEVSNELGRLANIYDFEAICHEEMIMWSLESLYNFVRNREISKPKREGHIYVPHKWIHGIEIHVMTELGFIKVVLPYMTLLNELKLRIRKKIGKNEGL